jgi:hypothetical protein
VEALDDEMIPGLKALEIEERKKEAPKRQENTLAECRHEICEQQCWSEEAIAERRRVRQLLMKQASRHGEEAPRERSQLKRSLDTEDEASQDTPRMKRSHVQHPSMEQSMDDTAEQMGQERKNHLRTHLKGKAARRGRGKTGPTNHPLPVGRVKHEKTEEERLTINEQEQMRRTELKMLFNILEQHLPDHEGKKRTQPEILLDTVKYIERLKSKNTKLESAKAGLEQKQKEFLERKLSLS